MEAPTGHLNRRAAYLEGPCIDSSCPMSDSHLWMSSLVGAVPSRPITKVPVRDHWKATAVSVLPRNLIVQ